MPLLAQPKSRNTVIRRQGIVHKSNDCLLQQHKSRSFLQDLLDKQKGGTAWRFNSQKQIREKAQRLSTEPAERLQGAPEKELVKAVKKIKMKILRSRVTEVKKPSLRLTVPKKASKPEEAKIATLNPERKSSPHMPA